ncbi:hypothetical protein DWG14_08150 [Streptomyces griseorubiginosus]|uniref:Uncharacterized protein n=1 Tax=Streptomyces griseorubiginosus TaxID=67304 RepID=A0AAI8L980_9ACTN|nr:hypothetical protein DWG14_08150 [Streptomyces griseorubiginosus]
MPSAFRRGALPGTLGPVTPLPLRPTRPTGPATGMRTTPNGAETKNPRGRPPAVRFGLLKRFDAATDP